MKFSDLFKFRAPLWWGCDAIETMIVVGAIAGLIFQSWIPLLICLVVGFWWENVR